MALENFFGNLLVYKDLVPGTFQHSDQLTTERRTNHGLRNQGFYTADGHIYTVQKRTHLWAITREPQNLVLQNFDEAYRQLTRLGNYFPDPKAARTSLEHDDTIVIDLKGIRLPGDSSHRQGCFDRFEIDPKNVKYLSSEERRAAQRIFGPDEDNFNLNMEMFAKAGITPHVVVPKPDYFKKILRSDNKEFLGRASWLNSFNLNSNFRPIARYVSNHSALRGVRRVIDALESEYKPNLSVTMPVYSQMSGIFQDGPLTSSLEDPTITVRKKEYVMLELAGLTKGHTLDDFVAFMKTGKIK